MGMVSRHRDGGAVHCRCEAFGRSQGAGFSGCGFPEGLGSRLFRKIRKRFQVKLKLTVTRFFGSFVFGLLGGGLNTLVVFHCLFWHVKTTLLTEHMIYP